MGRSQLTVLFSLILVALLHSVASQNKKYLLSSDTKPVYYDVQLTTRIDNNTRRFDGKVRIEIVPQTPTTTIEVNNRELTIGKVTLVDDDGVSADPQQPTTVGEIVTIKTGKELTPGNKYQLTLEYHGDLRTDNAGFYESYYVNSKNEKKLLATTQFETTDARHGFPCYDEPALKARFDITITHGKSYYAVSNMPVKSRIVNGELATTKFETTPYMSTYLVAFVVSDFEFLKTMADGRNASVYSKPEDVENGALALKIGKRVLKEFENYLGVGYNLPKMDQFAIPDFAAGAMENWGLVTYREEMLLYTEGVSTTATKTKISNTIAHEFAHQWFGDLVSPAWWDYTWLNEGFATLFAYIGTNKLYPNWNIHDYFMVQEYQKALSFDGTNKKRPMTHHVETKEQIASVFDTISYSKAGSVLRMIQKAMGEDNFRKGLTKYLNTHKEASATPQDLFAALNDYVPDGVLKADFVEFAKSWANSAGVPVVNALRKYDSKEVNLKQQEYRPESDTAIRESPVWYIPINFVTPAKEEKEATSTAPEVLLKGEPIVHKLEKLESSDWLLLNRENTGYYRVNYDEANWNMLAKQLQTDHSQIHKYQRAQLIDDAFALALTGNVTFEIALNVTRYIEREQEYVPWAAAANVFEILNNMLDETDSYENFTYFIANMTSKKFDDFSFSPVLGDSHLDTFTRKLVVDWACRADVNKCRKNANDLLNKHMHDNFIHPDAREVIYCNGLRNANESEFNVILQRLHGEKDAAVRRELMSVLGCVLKDKLLKQYMNESLTTNIYRKQELLNILPAVYTRSNPGITAAVQWLTANWKAYSKIGTDFTKVNPLISAVQGIAARIYNEKQSTEFKKLAEAIKDVDADVSLAVTDALKTIDANINWANNNRKLVTGWFKDYRTWALPRGSAGFILPSVTLIFTLIISVFFCQN